MSISDLHKAARAYALAGIPVFPCKTGGKTPAVNGGLKAATTNLRQINSWWGKQGWNIGADPHPPGFCVIDAEVNADHEWVERLPSTYTIQTPRGGFHFWYRGSLPSTVQKLGPHIDTRGSGTGYVLMPPSQVDGKIYRVKNKSIAVPLPDWVKLPEPVKPLKNGHDVELDLPGNIGRAITYLKGLPEMWVGDGSDDGAYKAACMVRAVGLSQDKTFEVMLEHFKCEPKDSLYNSWLHQKISNAFNYATNPPGVDASPGSKAFAKAPVVEQASKSRLVSRLASEIKPKKIEWLWPNRFPRGKLAIVAGHQDLGKTTVLLDIAARVSTGAHWPNGEGRAEQGFVLYFSAEDTPDDTIVPRLMAAGAAMNQIRIVECVRCDEGPKTFNFATDLEELDKLLSEIGNVRLVIFDPISSYFGKTDTFRNTEVRAVLEPLVRISARHRVTIIGNTHLAKGSKGPAMMRVLDSVAMTATGRAGYMVTQDPDDAHLRLFLRGKGNLGPPIEGLSFRIKSKFVTPEIAGTYIAWEQGTVTESADDVYSELDKGQKDRSVALTEAKDWLKKFLADGPKASAEVFTAGHANGHSEPTLRRAAKAIGVVSSKHNMRSGWIMSLPK